MLVSSITTSWNHKSHCLVDTSWALGKWGLFLQLNVESVLRDNVRSVRASSEEHQWQRAGFVALQPVAASRGKIFVLVLQKDSCLPQVWAPQKVIRLHPCVHVHEDYFHSLCFFFCIVPRWGWREGKVKALHVDYVLAVGCSSERALLMQWGVEGGELPAPAWPPSSQGKCAACIFPAAFITLTLMSVRTDLFSHSEHKQRLMCILSFSQPIWSSQVPQVLGRKWLLIGSLIYSSLRSQANSCRRASS